MPEKIIDWLPIKTEYITTKMTHAELAEKYGITRSGVEKVAAKENWTGQRKSYEDEVLKKSLKELQKDSVKTRVDMIKAGIFLVGQGLTAIRERSLSPQDYKEALSALRAGKELIVSFLPKELSATIDEAEDTPEGIKRWLLNVQEKFGQQLIEKFGDEDEEP